MVEVTNPSSSLSDSSHDHLVLGVDGGGTKTLAWLAERGTVAPPSALGRGLSGSSNPQAVGLETAQQNIVAAIDQAFDDAGLPARPVAAACLALAGVGREPIRLKMLRWAQSATLAHHVQVVHDARAVLAAGTRDGSGVALICGTGSFAYGVAHSGAHARSGGWGYLLGDEGSGYAIGCAALRAVARAADGRGRTTLLTATILEQLQLAEPAQLIPTIYDAPSVRDAVAALAPLVFRTADEGDDAAQQICQAAAQELAELVRAVNQQLGFTECQYDLAMAGGLLVHQPAWAASVASNLADLHCQPHAMNVVSEPVAGAVLIACRARS